ncbi:hypothetical protein JM49_13535 [Pseudomonas chlororaphis subsp. aurantiaca]|nr:hypothetical protein JM49_13535 [Pseudomonas chlororaphis subsp. aurantiaca]
MEKLAHGAVSEFRGHGEWFECAFDDAVLRVSPLLTEDMAWTIEWEECRREEQKLGGDALIRGLFPNGLDHLKASDEDRFIDRLKSGLFERAIRNYMSFIAVDLTREQVLDEKILNGESELELLEGVSIDQACDLVFLRAVSSDEYLRATMLSGVYLGHVTENCMMVTGDANKIPDMINVVERLARERMAAGEPAP